MRNKLRFLAIIAVGVLLLPGVVLAQAPTPPVLFEGSVTIDGVDAPVGTVISAEIEGVEVAANAPDGITEAGNYALPVPSDGYIGKMVVFKVDGVVGGQHEYVDPMKTAIVALDLSIGVTPEAASSTTSFLGGLGTKGMIGIISAVVAVIAAIVFLVVRRRSRYD